ncbi:hypothetical protein Landi51_12654 [Colletotrichum acutatum]
MEVTAARVRQRPPVPPSPSDSLPERREVKVHTILYPSRAGASREAVHTHETGGHELSGSFKLQKSHDMFSPNLYLLGHIQVVMKVGVAESNTISGLLASTTLEPILESGEY